MNCEVIFRYLQSKLVTTASLGVGEGTDTGGGDGGGASERAVLENRNGRAIARRNGGGGGVVQGCGGVGRGAGEDVGDI